MRTGSNLLESNLNGFADIECHGEAFNPSFVGYPNRDEVLGVTREGRDLDPFLLLAAIKDQPDVLAGFRYFNDHDPRILSTVLNDTRCAKIILTRNPLESYVSLGIARSTGQWKLTNVKRRKEGQATFEDAEFEQYLTQLQTFQLKLLKSLQASGQTAYYLSYEDLQDLDVINGLTQFLGVAERLEKFDNTLKKQNPSPLEDKVSNYDEMKQALAKFDYFSLSRTPNFEPRRPPAVPSYVLAAKAPLMYMPVRSGVEDQVCSWLADLDGYTADCLPSKLPPKELRQWKLQNVGHRSFSVLRHPVVRAHAVFCSKILSTGPDNFGMIRKKLRNFYKLQIPGRIPHPDYGRKTHKEAFKAFLKFLRANLAGQTDIRVDAHWATQAAVLQGMSNFAIPHRVYHEEELETELPALSEAIGYGRQPYAPIRSVDEPYALSEIYDEEIENLAKMVYQRDYVMFGFDRWK
ncbi:sulfotransferase family 2 domain-containing protein [Roseovarius albus]|nr:sulfotransferase family 2 domain-containing protein [Roseovarius albus]